MLKRLLSLGAGGPLVLLVLLADACGGFCNDGVFAGTVVLEQSGFMVRGATSSDDQRFPYAEGSPFEQCRVLGGLSASERGARVDGDDYPVLEELGFISVEIPDDGGERIVDEVRGFDSVTSFGGMGGAGGGASVREVSGLNNVEVVSGSLLTSASITGMRTLREVSGDLDVANLPGPVNIERIGGSFEINGAFEEIDLAKLERVGGNLNIFGSRLRTAAFPSLNQVGGFVQIFGNPLESWSGFAHSAAIAGDFTAQGNGPINDDAFRRWLEESETSVGGTVTICANEADRGELTNSCP